MYKRVFLDTNPIIYLLQDTKPYSVKIRHFLIECMNDKSEFYTSTITDAEFLYKPYSENNNSDVELYKSFLNSLNILKCFISESIAEQSAKLRAKYKSLKLADALQLATSIEAHCDAFLTNDKQLCQISEIPIIYLGNL